MPVQVEQEQLEPCRVALTITVPKENVQSATEAVFQQIARRTTVPGFRAGKAPAHLVRRFMDESRLHEMAYERTVSDAYTQAVKQSGIRPYSQVDPKLEMPDEELGLDEGFTFKAVVPLEPQVLLGDLEGLTARKITVLVGDEDVERELERQRAAQATYQETSEPAVEGDRVRVDITITVDGEVLEESEPGKPIILVAGNNFAGFDEHLFGLTAGEDRSFEFTYPENEDVDEGVRGKLAVANLHCHLVLRHSLPTDEALCEKLGIVSIDEVKERIRLFLQAQANAMAEQSVDDDLLKEYIRRSTANFPSEMVDAELSGRIRELLNELEQRGSNVQEYVQGRNQTLSELQDEMRKESEETIVNSLVLLALASQNGVRITEDDLEAEVKEHAARQGVKVSQMRRHLRDSGELETIQNRLFFRKITDFLRSKATIEVVEG